MKNQKIIKNILIILTLIVVAVGIFFGITFYQASKVTGSTPRGGNNTDLTRTPFQTKVATGSDITIIDTSVKPDEVENPLPILVVEKNIPKLVELWKEPVSGFDFLSKDIQVEATTTKGTSTILTTKTIKNQLHIYVWDRATGNIYENLASSTDVSRTSNLTSPGVQEATFISPTTVFTQELDLDNETIIRSYVNLYKETATSTLYTASKKRVFVYADYVSISPENKKMFYTLTNTGKAYVSNLDLSSVLNVLNTNITQWIPQYINKKTLSLTTKPSAYFPGYLFFVNSDGTQENQYILGEKYGLTTLTSPNNTKVLYNEIENDSLFTSIYDTKTKKTVRLTQATLTEKCVWSNDSKKIYCAIPQTLKLAPYPDAWYQGKTEFSDNIWSINPETGKFDIEVALQDQVPQKIDAYNLKISSNKQYLLFQDKYTLHLWKYTF